MEGRRTDGEERKCMLEELTKKIFRDYGKENRKMEQI